MNMDHFRITRLSIYHSNDTRDQKAKYPLVMMHCHLQYSIPKFCHKSHRNPHISHVNSRICTPLPRHGLMLSISRVQYQTGMRRHSQVNNLSARIYLSRKNGKFPKGLRVIPSSSSRYAKLMRDDDDPRRGFVSRNLSMSPLREVT